MQRIFQVEGSIQHYAWGGPNFIRHLLGLPEGKEPCAEYWLGAHKSAPSLASEGLQKVTLEQLIKENPEGRLGEAVFKKFGRLPFLFKVLDVNKMLSIQVHPTKTGAEKGFREENKKGIPLDANNRNYKDDNHKPEIMVALSDFWLLHGFLPKDRLTAMLEKEAAFASFIPVFEKGGYKALYQHVMQLTEVESDSILRPMIERITPFFLRGEIDKSSPDYWAAKAVTGHPESKHFDKGIFSIYFFNIVEVKKGEAVFQGAGIPHAYLQGQNIELMANSDNVLRGGLTAKHIDVPELLKHIIFEETRPKVLKGELQKDDLERIYSSPAPDFQLSCINLKKGQHLSKRAATAEIFLVMEGEVKVTDKEGSLSLKKGGSFLVTAQSEFSIVSLGRTELYRATTP